MLKKLFKKDRHDSVEERLADLRALMFTHAPTIISKLKTEAEAKAAENGSSKIEIDIGEYIRDVRLPLNSALIQLSMGLTLEVKEKNDKQHFKFGPKPDFDDIAKASEMLEYFIEHVERPFYELFDTNVSVEDEDDMSIPDDIETDDAPDVPVGQIAYVKEILIPEKDNNILKMSRKKLLKLYNSRLSKGTIKPSHLLQLYKTGLILRKRRKAKITVISVATVAALVGAAIFIGYKCSKDNEPDRIEDISPDDIEDIDDIDDVDIGDVDDDIDDVPVVDIDDDAIAV